MARSEIIPFNVLDPFSIADAFVSPFYRRYPVADAAHELGSFKADVKEDADKYTVTADFPGADKDDIELKLDDDVLTVQYEKKNETGDKDEDGKWLTHERTFEKVARAFTLQGADEEGAEASLDNGVLTITIPKKHDEKAETKKITIK